MLLTTLISGQPLLVDLRGKTNNAAHELVWWNWMTKSPDRRFPLRDSLCGEGGVGALLGEEHLCDVDSAPLDVSFSVHPWRIATAWEWTNKEDGICVYDADTKEVVEFRTPYKTHVERLALAADGNVLALATINDMDGSRLFEAWQLTPKSVPAEPPSGQGRLGYWQLAVQTRLRDEQVACSNRLGEMTAFAFDGRFVAAADTDRAMIVWDSLTQPPRQEEQEPGSSAEDEFSQGPFDPPLIDVGFVPQCLAFASPAPLLVIGGTGLLAQELETKEWISFARSGSLVTALAFTADGRMLLAGTEEGTVELWDLATRKLIQGFDWGLGCITAVALAPDGCTCSAGTDTGSVIVWDLGG